MQNCPNQSSFMEITNSLSSTFNFFSESFLLFMKKKNYSYLRKKTNGSKDVRRDAPSCNSLKWTLSKFHFDLAVIILRRIKTWFLSELTHFWPMLPFTTPQKHQKANRKVMVFSGGRSIKWKYCPEMVLGLIQ